MFFFFFKQKTAYELRIRYWSSDVCSSDLAASRPWSSSCSRTCSRANTSRTRGSTRTSDGRQCARFCQRRHGERHATPENFQRETVRRRWLHGGGRAAGSVWHIKRSEERRVGYECVSTWRSRGCRVHKKKKNK